MKDQLRRIGVTAPIDVVPLWVDTDHIPLVEPAVGRGDGRAACPPAAQIEIILRQATSRP